MLSRKKKGITCETKKGKKKHMKLKKKKNKFNWHFEPLISFA